ncbi:hypothetical protein BBF96_09110 [Anoxybacter fermentans]|uniref:Uncharacterized protein n=1 Tax=Anoxybacter fermentans TaxID=1323375 RepID=A0A3S9SZ44_9FIRM|nr:hypothetical protein [Anoxybacter fermentans]AZR73530.1 hypothetical protein BBF96_09110 [Anoxybacter fermentans]
MGIFDFFRRKKKKIHKIDSFDQPDLKKTLSEDPYDGKIKAALSLKKEGREEEAEILLRQIIEEKKEHVRAWFVLAEYFIETDAVGRALYCFERVVEYQPTNQKARDQIAKLKKIVRSRPDYLWEYNQEKGII